MYRIGACVRLAIRSSTAFVSGWPSHSLWEHQHCWLVRTGESWSPASERSKWLSQLLTKASASASLTNFSSVSTQGATSPPALGRLGARPEEAPGRLMTFGLYCGNSRRMREKVLLMPPLVTAGGVRGGRLHAMRFCSHESHDAGHCSRMKAGFLSHSPERDQSTHACGETTETKKVRRSESTHGNFGFAPWEHGAQWAAQWAANWGGSTVASCMSSQSKASRSRGHQLHTRQVRGQSMSILCKKGIGDI